MNRNSVEDCLEFFQKMVPDPESKNIHTQIGCHFEEVVEMLDTITSLDEDTTLLISQAAESVHALAEHLKATDDTIRIDPENRVEFLDAVADQMVTGIGSCHMLGIDVVGGFNEVNESNLSKFGEDGEPIFDVNRKMTKGPFYRKAELEPFV
jgi:predicted HAD superfamily Cof-like phosphohydrolase